ncbi:MAG TPA: hypothetical protein VLA82_11210 [Actinomycetota bacterium]|nr:hypothetical protein [Actinomycetota bacterium]
MSKPPPSFWQDPDGVGGAEPVDDDEPTDGSDSGLEDTPPAGPGEIPTD